MMIKGGLWEQLQSDLTRKTYFKDMQVYSSVKGIADFNRRLFRGDLEYRLDTCLENEVMTFSKYSQLRQMLKARSISDLNIVELIIEQYELNIQRKRASV
jgi:hypothetical protein